MERDWEQSKARRLGSEWPGRGQGNDGDMGMPARPSGRPGKE